MKVSVFMDVEDPINPLADDAALDLAHVFTDAGVRGSFCLTGDKCASLLDRGRQDVIDAYRSHCLGLHTNGHSRHPTTMELLAEVDFESGCTLAFEEESKGFAKFLAAFQRSPAFWGGAGNTWSPEITHAAHRLGIPAISYALTEVPGQKIHELLGVLALPQHFSIGEDTWADSVAASQASEHVLRSVQASALPWVGVFVGHPTRFRHVNYWDTPYFAGRTPPTPEFTDPQPVERYEAAKKNLRQFLLRLADVADIVGVDVLSSLPWTFRSPTKEEISGFRAQTEANIVGASRWPVHRAGLSPTRILEKTWAVEPTLRIADL